jgi:hypothetical protein
MIIQQLLGTFEAYSAAGEEDDEAAFGATECLETITTVLEVIKENATAVGAVEGLLTPLLSKIFSSDDMIEYIENGIQIISYLTFYPENINPVRIPPSPPLPLTQSLFIPPIGYLADIWTDDCCVRQLGV